MANALRILVFYISTTSKLLFSKETSISSEYCCNFISCCSSLSKIELLQPILSSCWIACWAPWISPSRKQHSAKFTYRLVCTLLSFRLDRGLWLGCINVLPLHDCDLQIVLLHHVIFVGINFELRIKVFVFGRLTNYRNCIHFILIRNHESIVFNSQGFVQWEYH